MHLGFSIIFTPTVHLFYSVGSIVASHYFTGAHMITRPQYVALYAGCYISFYHHLSIWASKVQKKNTCPNDFYLPQREKSPFCIESHMSIILYTNSLPDLGNCYSLIFQNTCPNLTFTCPGQSGKYLCSTLSSCIQKAYIFSANFKQMECVNAIFDL